MIRSDRKLFNLIPVSLLLAAALFLLALFVFSFLAHEAVFEHEDVFDSRVFNFFHAHVTPGILSFMRVYTYLGSHLFLFPAYIVLVAAYLIRGHKTEALDISIIAITSTLLMFGLKYFFHRPRPDLPLFNAVKGYSFPSGHALSSFIFCSILIHLIRHNNWSKGAKWSVSILLLLMTVGIGISRIVLRVHYATDVVAGFCLGFAWVTLLLTLQDKLRGKMHVEPGNAKWSPAHHVSKP